MGYIEIRPVVEFYITNQAKSIIFVCLRVASSLCYNSSQIDVFINNILIRRYFNGY